MIQNRGKTVWEAIEKSGYNKSILAKKLGISRSALYNWKDEINLSWDKVFRIGKIIKHNFSEDFPELNKPSNYVSEPMVEYNSPGTYDDCMKELADIRIKYIRQLEENQKLLRKIIELQNNPPNHNVPVAQ